VPGGTSGQLVPLDQDDILPTHLGQVVGNAATPDTAADNYNLRMTGKFCHLKHTPL
jgi:hypothetical protein